MSFPRYIRKIIFARDDATCCDCGKLWSDCWMLHCAHYNHSGDGYADPDNGRMLCISCHIAEHRQGTDLGKKGDKKAIKRLIKLDERTFKFYR